MKPRSIILTRFLAQEEKRKQLEKEAENIVANSNPTAVTVMQDITNIVKISQCSASKPKGVWWEITHKTLYISRKVPLLSLSITV